LLLGGHLLAPQVLPGEAASQLLLAQFLPARLLPTISILLPIISTLLLPNVPIPGRQVRYILLSGMLR
jgi:hypothetical protein